MRIYLTVYLCVLVFFYVCVFVFYLYVCVFVCVLLVVLCLWTPWTWLFTKECIFGYLYIFTRCLNIFSSRVRVKIYRTSTQDIYTVIWKMFCLEITLVKRWWWYYLHFTITLKMFFFVFDVLWFFFVDIVFIFISHVHLGCWIIFIYR